MRHLSHALILLLCLCTVGCATPSTLPPDAGDEPLPDANADTIMVVQVLPGSGPVSGGTVVTILGSGFSEDLSVRFGVEACTRIEVDADDRLVCHTPLAEGSGAVDVVVAASDEGRSGVLPDGFLYMDARQGLPAWCSLRWPHSTTASVGEPTELIFGHVYELDTTDGVGQGSGVEAQLGHGPDGTDPSGDAGWTWEVAEFNVDIGDRDEYMASLTLESTGVFDYVYRFSVDGGQSWLYCDTSGSDDGYQPDDAGDLVVQ